MRWTTDLLDKAEALLRSTGSVAKACEGMGVANHALSHAFARHGRGRPDDVARGVGKRAAESMPPIDTSDFDFTPRNFGPAEHLSGTGDAGIAESRIRVVIPDSHGAYIDPVAAKVFLDDLAMLGAKEVVFLGDHVDVSGIYSAHPPNYVEDREYSYETDIASAAAFIDAVQKRAPGATMHYIEGNHENHVERWISRVVTHAKDARAMLSLQAPEVRLELKRRGIRYIKRSECYDGLAVTGTMQLGKAFFTHGFTASKFATAQHVQRYGNNVIHGHCFSSDTELLSLDGWVGIDDVFAGMPVATLHPETKAVVFQPVQQTFKYDDYTEVYRFQSSCMDHLVTADHGMVYVADRRYPELAQRPAKDTDTNCYFYVAGIVAQPSDPNWTEDEIRLWVQCITDGSCEQGKWRWHLKKQRKIDALTSLLTRLGLPFTVSGLTKKGARKIYVGTLPAKFTKRLTGVAREFSREQVTALLDEWSRTDGTRYVGAAQLCTSVREYADMLQELAVISGHKCNLSSRPYRQGTMYALSVRWNVTQVFCRKGYNKGPEPYEGQVWCVSVKNGTLLARRNGKVLVTANTHRVQEYGTRTVSNDAIGGWCPGTLALLQPLYQHTNPTEWRHGYGVQAVGADGKFVHINVPIVGVWSGLRALLGAMRPKEWTR
jgi:hypothetical protein